MIVRSFPKKIFPSDFVLCWKLVRFEYALYAISVRQTEALPQASFRLHLTVDALALS